MMNKSPSPPPKLQDDYEAEFGTISSLLSKLGMPEKPKKAPSRSFDFNDPRLKTEKPASSRRDIDHSMPVDNVLVHGHVEPLQPMSSQEISSAKKIVHTREVDEQEAVCRYVPREKPQTRNCLSEVSFVIVRERKGHGDNHYPITNPEVLPTRSPFVRYVVSIALKPRRRTEEIVEKLVAANRLSDWDGRVILARKLQFAQITSITSWTWQPLEVQKIAQKLHETALAMYAKEPDKCTISINPNRTESRADLSSTSLSKARGKKYLTLDALRHSHCPCAQSKKWLIDIVLEGVFLSPVELAARNVAMATPYGSERYAAGAYDEVSATRIATECGKILEMPVLWALQSFLLEPDAAAAKPLCDEGSAANGERCNVNYMVKARHIEDMARRAGVLDINFIWNENKLSPPYWGRLPHSDMILYVAGAIIIHMHGRFHRYMESMVNLSCPETIVNEWRRFWPEHEAMPSSQVKVRCPMGANMVLETAVAALAKCGYIEASVDNKYATLTSLKKAQEDLATALRQFSKTQPSPSLTLIDASRTNRHALEALLLELAGGNEADGSVVVAMPVGRDAHVLSGKIRSVLMAMSSPRFVVVSCDLNISSLIMDRAKTLVVVDCHRWTYGNLTRVLVAANMNGKVESLVLVEDWFLSSSDMEHECPQVNHSLEICKQFWLEPDMRCDNPFCKIEPQPITCNDVFDTLMKNLPVIARAHGFSKINVGFLHPYSRLDSDISTSSVSVDRRLSTSSTHEYHDIAVALQKATSASSLSSVHSSTKSSATDQDSASEELPLILGANLGKPTADEGMHVNIVQLLRLLRVAAISNFDLELNQFVFKLQMWPSVAKSDPLRTGYNCAVSVVQSDLGMVLRAFDPERVIEDCSDCGRVYGRSLAVYCHREYEEKKKFDARVKTDQAFRASCTHVGAMMWHYELGRYVIISEKLASEKDDEESFTIAFEHREIRTHNVVDLSAEKTDSSNEPRSMACHIHRSCSDLGASDSKMISIGPMKMDDAESPPTPLSHGDSPLSQRSSGGQSGPGAMAASSCVRFTKAKGSDMIPARYITMGKEAPPTDMVVIVIDAQGKASKEVDCRSLDAVVPRANKLLVLSGRDIDIKDTMMRNASTIGSSLFKRLDNSSCRSLNARNTEVCVMNGQCPDNDPAAAGSPLVPAGRGSKKKAAASSPAQRSEPIAAPHVHTIMCEPGQLELAKVGQSVQTFVRDQSLSAYPNPRPPTGASGSTAIFAGTPLSSPRHSITPKDVLAITNLIAAGPPRKEVVATTGCINVPRRRLMKSMDSQEIARTTPENEVATFPEIPIRSNYLDSWNGSRVDSELEAALQARSARRKSMRQHTGSVVYDTGEAEDLNREIQNALGGVSNIGSRLAKLM